jgi:hypothetical protein
MDRSVQSLAGAWRDSERIAVCDSQRIDTLLAVPI